MAAKRHWAGCALLAALAGCAPSERAEIEVDLASARVAQRFDRAVTLDEARRDTLAARSVRFVGLPEGGATLRVGVASAPPEEGVAPPARRRARLLLTGPGDRRAEQVVDLPAAGFADFFFEKAPGAGATLRVAAAEGDAPLAIDRPSFSPRRARGRPDLLLVSIDTLRADALEWMPRLAALGREGRAFSRAWSTSNWTLPAHAGLFQSRAVHELALPRPGDRDPHPRARLPEELPTLAEALAAGGYATFATTEGGYIHPVYGFARGFESYATTSSRAQQGEDPLGVHLARFERFLAAGRGPRPFFAFVHTYEVHDYFKNDAAYHHHLEPGDERWAARGNVLALPVAERVFDFPPGFLRRLYRCGVERADEFLDRLIARAAAAAGEGGLLVVVVSDHGESFGEVPSVLGHHSSALDEQTRVPLVAWSPGRLAPGESATPVSLLDVAPSLLAFAGLEPTPSFRGRGDLFAATAPAARTARALPLAFDLQADRPADWTLVRGWVDGARKSVRTVRADGGAARVECWAPDAASLVDRGREPSECADLATTGERLLLAESGAALALSALRSGELEVDLELGRELAALDLFGIAAGDGKPGLDERRRPRFRIEAGTALLLVLAEDRELGALPLRLDGETLVPEVVASEPGLTIYRTADGEPALRVVERAFRPEAADAAARRAEVVRAAGERLRALGYLQ